MNAPAPDRNSQCVLALTVNNHPGVMSHICGLFSRRSFNLEGILCAPLHDEEAGGSTSRMWLLVAEDERLEQVVRQLEKLHDVLAVERGPVTDREWGALKDWFQAA